MMPRQSIDRNNTQISATERLSIRSGGDTTLIGAQLAGNKVNADIGATSASSRCKT